MAVSSVTCVYWEWQRDDGGFSPYVPDVSNAIEAANHAGMGGHNSGSYTVDFVRMIQRKNATGYERQVQRKQIVLPSAPDITAYWMWNEYGSSFVLYDIQSTVDIELAYANGYPSVDLSRCTSRLPYTIDFHRMEQTRHHYNTRRRVQRCPLPAGYSLQALLAFAPGLTGSASLMSGGGTAGMTTVSHGIPSTGGGGGFAFPGYGTGPVPTPAAPGMMNFAPSVPPSSGGHAIKSGGISTSTPFSLAGPTPSLSATHTSKSGVVASSTSTPAMMNSMTTGTAPSFPSGPGGGGTGGHMALGKSGGLTTSGGGLILKGGSRTSRTSGGKTRTVAVLGAAAAPPSFSSTSHSLPAPPVSTTASAVPYVGSTGSSAFTLLSANASLASAMAPTTTTTGAISPQKRRKKNKTASSLTGNTSGTAISSVMVAGSSSSKGGPSTSSAAAVKTEKSKARRKKREKKGTAARSVSGGRGESEGYNDETSKYARKKKRLKKGEDGPCPICMNQLSEDSGFGDDDDQGSTSSALDVCKLRKCGHMLHHPCLIMYMKNSSNSGFQCPTCKKSYGVKTGDMPNGQMNVQTLPSQQLPGHEGCGTIQITYNFRPGVYNGRRYNASAFPRTCYLPDSPKGRKVLKLLRVAWDRRLTFTIGTSVTSGMTDTVVWNEIHHKTTIQNYSGHGYPDPTYLDRVMLELAAQGVTEDSGGSDNEQGSSSSSSSSEDEAEVVEVGRAINCKKGETKANAIVLVESSDEDSDL